MISQPNKNKQTKTKQQTQTNTPSNIQKKSIFDNLLDTVPFGLVHDHCANIL